MGFFSDVISSANPFSGGGAPGLPGIGGGGGIPGLPGIPKPPGVSDSAWAKFQALGVVPGQQAAQQETGGYQVGGWLGKQLNKGQNLFQAAQAGDPDALKELLKQQYKEDQRNVGKAIATTQPIFEHALRNNPATMVAGTDKQAADALGWDWLSHMTGKTEQTFDRTSNKGAGFQEVFERGLADQMQAGTATPANVNRARLEADRAHVRTNSPQDIQAGIERGEYRVVGNDVLDRYGNTVLGKGLAQRGATALGAASVVFPWLAPFAAAANTATAYRHGAPAGKAIAQGVGGYYAGQAGGALGGQLGGSIGGATGAAVGRAAGSGAARGATTGYASGLRGGDLLEAAALGGLSGGAGQYLGMQFQNPILSGMARGAATGAVSGYRGGNIGQGISQGLLSGGLSGAGGLLAQSTGAPMTRQLPALAYQQWLMNQRRG